MTANITVTDADFPNVLALLVKNEVKFRATYGSITATNGAAEEKPKDKKPTVVTTWDDILRYRTISTMATLYTSGHESFSLNMAQRLFRSENLNPKGVHATISIMKRFGLLEKKNYSTWSFTPTIGEYLKDRATARENQAAA